MGEEPITYAIRIDPPKTKTITILQPGTIPPRPKWMVGEPGYYEGVARSCPVCRSNDIWRGPWCNKPEVMVRLIRMETPVKHSGRGRHSACQSCGAFWTDFQGIPYKIREEEDV